MKKFSLLAFGVLFAAVVLMIPAGINVSAQNSTSTSTQSNGNTDVSVFQGTGFVAVLVVTDPNAFGNGGGVAVPVGTNPSDSDITVVPAPEEEGETTTVVTDSNNTVITEIDDNNSDNTNVTVVEDGVPVVVDEDTQGQIEDNVDVIVDESGEIIDSLPTDSESNTDVSNQTDDGNGGGSTPVIPDNATVTIDENQTIVDAGNVTIAIPDNVTESENVTDTIVDIVDNATNGGGDGGLGEVTNDTVTEVPIFGENNTDVVQPDGGENVTDSGPIVCITAPCGEDGGPTDIGTNTNTTDNGGQTEPQVDPVPIDEPISNNTSTEEPVTGGEGGDVNCFVLGNDGGKALSLCITSSA